MERIISIARYYGSLKNMERKFERLSRQDAFDGKTREDWQKWKQDMRALLWSLLGLDHMETCELNPVLEERVVLPDGIVREKVIIQTEPEVYMPFYVLIPFESREEKHSCFITPPGHQGAGKYSIAGCDDIPAVADKIRFYNYDYGMQLAKLGYVALCPDSRGLGERRDEALQMDDESSFLNSTCFHLAHMAEPMGQTVAGMCTWDLMRLIDYVEERKEWRMDSLGCLGFSGGGMQTMWLAAMDERVKQAVISGYLYGYRDSLLKLNGNCSCNYVPRLWEHLDMGDITSLIAPRPMLIQSCKDDKLNGERGIQNVLEQLKIVQNAYDLWGKKNNIIHEICEGDHRWHGEDLKKNLECLRYALEK